LPITTLLQKPAIVSFLQFSHDKGNCFYFGFHL
jgi:hypothetical protein